MARIARCAPHALTLDSHTLHLLSGLQLLPIMALRTPLRPTVKLGVDGERSPSNSITRLG